jgi:hypothetical protein
MPGKNLMPSYDFEVWQDDRVLHNEKSVEIEAPARAWAYVGRLATQYNAPGCRIVVKDERGDIAILVGLRTAKAILAAQAARTQMKPRRTSAGGASCVGVNITDRARYRGSSRRRASGMSFLGEVLPSGVHQERQNSVVNR